MRLNGPFVRGDVANDLAIRPRGIRRSGGKRNENEQLVLAPYHSYYSYHSWYSRRLAVRPGAVCGGGLS